MRRALWIQSTALVVTAFVTASAQERASLDLVPPVGWQFRPAAGIAYDSFGQRYEIADEDTLDLVDELSGQFITLLQRNGNSRLYLKNTFSYGEEASRNDLALSLQRDSEHFGFSLRNEARYKGYRNRSEFSISSDYFLNTTRVRLDWRLHRAVRLRLDERFEMAEVKDRNRYNFDYKRNDVGLELERRWGIFSNLRGGYSFGQRSVPDSTSIDYNRHVFALGWNQQIGSSTLAIEQQLERRLFGDPSVRSHYLDVNTTASWTLPFTTNLRLRPEYRAVALRYDSPDSIYASGHEHTLDLLLERDFTEHVSIGVGPSGGLRRSDSVFEADYEQWGLQGSISYLSSRLWLQFTNEFGFRSHTNNPDEFFTDYVFNWTTLFVSYEMWGNATFDLFLSLNPESHEDERNNTTTMLLSTSLTVEVP